MRLVSENAALANEQIDKQVGRYKLEGKMGESVL